MKWLTFKIQRQEPGFRFNLIDLGLLLLLGALSLWLRGAMPESSLFAVPLYIGLSFFLFCNVFRIGNRLERIWYIPFAIAAAACIHLDNERMLWMLALFLFEPLKWGLIFHRYRRDDYHGAFADCGRGGKGDE